MIQNAPCSYLIQFSVRVLDFLNVDISLMLRCYLTEIHKTLNTITGGIPSMHRIVGVITKNTARDKRRLLKLMLLIN